MPWCPQCKVEYVEGKQECVDCGSTLVESLEKEPFKFLETEKELFAKKFVDFLIYSKISNVSYEYDEAEQKWMVLIDESTRKQVTKLYNVFYAVEITGATENTRSSANQKAVSESDLTALDEKEVDIFDSSNDTDSGNADGSEDKYSSLFDEEELESIIESKKPKTYIPPAYVKKEDQYKDLKSTAFTFFFVALLGIGVLILNAVGVLPLFDGVMTYIVMGGLFIAFLYIGVTTYAKSQKVEKEISSENNLTQSIERWLNQNITKEHLDAIDKESDNPEISFFKKIDHMKELILEEFGEVDEGYLDQLLEEYYNSHFE